MSQQASAVIIPFPRTAAPPAQDLAQDRAQDRAQDLAQSSERLARALTSLSMALAEQRDSTVRWRLALEDLAAKMQHLGNPARG